MHSAGCWLLDAQAQQVVPGLGVTEVARKTSELAAADPIHPIQPSILAGFRQYVGYSSYPLIQVMAASMARRDSICGISVFRPMSGCVYAKDLGQFS